MSEQTICARCSKPIEPRDYGWRHVGGEPIGLVNTHRITPAKPQRTMWQQIGATRREYIRTGADPLGDLITAAEAVVAISPPTPPDYAERGTASSASRIRSSARRKACTPIRTAASFTPRPYDAAPDPGSRARAQNVAPSDAIHSHRPTRTRQMA